MGGCDAGECAGDDLVADTRDACEPNYGCKTFLNNAFNLCGTDGDGEMYMNYMYYGDVACLVMFTEDQKQRMQAVLSGPRSMLLSSLGCQLPNGINEVNLSNNISIFPNPSSGTFNLEIKNIKNDHIEVFNVVGEKVFESQIISALTKIDLSNQSNGIYYLKLTSSNGTGNKKIIIN
jgi:hypothetical protein